MQSFIANETILPCRAVSLLTTAIGKCAVMASDTTPGWGISQKASRRSAVFGTNAEAAAISGEPVGVYDDGEECDAEIGGTVTIRDRLTVTGSAGLLVTTTTDRKEYIAIALQSGVSGDRIRVKVQRGQTSNA